MTRRPVVGITCYVEPASWGPWVRVRASLVPQGYVDHVVRAGGRPVVLPPLSATEGVDGAVDEAGVDDLLDRLDGLVVAGGVDVEPSRYGATAHPAVQSARPERDAAELALVRAATRRDLPLLGVCRGMQVMAVAAGGTLVQHLPDRLGHDEHSPGPGVYGRHGVTTAPGSLLQQVIGDEVEVSSYHHQGVETFPGLTVVAWAPDGTVEALEGPGRFRLGVQWHPETDDDVRLMTALVDAARDTD